MISAMSPKRIWLPETATNGHGAQLFNRFIIEKRISDEKAALEAEKRKQLANKPSNFDESFRHNVPIGMAPTTGDWYFYNASIIRSGSTEFRKKMGNT